MSSLLVDAPVVAWQFVIEQNVVHGDARLVGIFILLGKIVEFLPKLETRIWILIHVVQAS